LPLGCLCSCSSSRPLASPWLCDGYLMLHLSENCFSSSSPRKFYL
jgi:hypothetical protein